MVFIKNPREIYEKSILFIKMSIELDKTAIKNIKEYKYKTSGSTWIEANGYNDVWDTITSWLPRWVVPNQMTLIGTLMPILAGLNMLSYDLTLTKELPRSVFLFNFLSILWFQTLDACDGKQARRINNCSPLGQILDHNLDQVT